MILIVLGSSCSIGFADDVSIQPEENREFDWDISESSDDKEEGSDAQFVFNKVRFRGALYSQTLADEATLEAKFVVTAASEIRVHFYEYLDSSWNKITESKERSYRVEVKTSTDQEYIGKARCHISCLLAKELSQRVHKQLMTGQNAQFRFYDGASGSDSNTIRYKFSTGKHRGYGQTFRKL